MPFASGTLAEAILPATSTTPMLKSAARASLERPPPLHARMILLVTRNTISIDLSFQVLKPTLVVAVLAVSHHFCLRS
jgi:hypothetical protein